MYGTASGIGRGSGQSWTRSASSGSRAGVRSQSIVRAQPVLEAIVAACQPSSSRACDGSDSSTSTSLASGRSRAGSSTVASLDAERAGTPASKQLADRVAAARAELDRLARRCPAAVAARTNPSHVSRDEGEVAARVEPAQPELAGAGEQLGSIVGITARADCRGP